ncbi:MAG: type I-E CRISPR-associated protein Cse2/CasB [Thermodesulfobacteriota bacterium]
MMINLEKSKKAIMPNFTALWERYHDVLSAGHRAELRRVRCPDELRDVPALYRLLGGRRPNERWLRVVYMLPYLKHSLNGKSLGAQIAEANVSEARLFQVVRSEEPNDLVQLRRILQQVEPMVNIDKLGPDLFFWDNKRNKQKLVEDYFVSKFRDKEKKND